MDLITYGLEKLRYLSMFHAGVQVVTISGLYILNQSFYLIYLSALYTVSHSYLLSSFLLFVPFNILWLLFNKCNLSKLSLGLLTFIRLSEHCQDSSPHRILTYKWCNQRRRPWHYQLMQSWHQYHIGNSYWSCYRPLWRTFKS